MKTLILIFLVFSTVVLEGCISVPYRSSQKIDAKKAMLESLESLMKESNDPQTIAKKYIIQNSSQRKTAFLMAFNKLGFDLVEIAKLMDEQDDKELSIKKFVIKNKKKLRVLGTLDEIRSFPQIFNSTNQKIVDDIIQHLELNYKFYLKVNFNIYEQ